MSRSVRLLLVLAALAAAAAWYAARPALPRTNVLLISIDSLVRDRLGLYGHRPVFAPGLKVSPHLDSLARSGAVFDDAQAPSSWTLPSHMSLMTGLSDLGHGVVEDGDALDPLRGTLAERFRRAGAETFGVYSGPFLDPRHGFGRGFDEYRSAMMPREELTAEIAQWAERRRRAGDPVDERVLRGIRDRVSHYDVTSPRVTAAALDFLDRRDPERPFFLFLHYFDAHFDYLPDRMEDGLGHRFDPAYEGPFDGTNWMFDRAVRDYDPATGRTLERRIGERDLEHVRALYDAEIHWVDRHIGHVLDRLEELGLAEDTVVCVVSDHGDEFFEHGSLGHRSTLFPELTEAALVLRAPGRTRAGQRLPQLVRLADVAPTLLDLAGLPPAAEATGRSLVPLLTGTEPPPPASTIQRLLASQPPLEAWRDADFAVHRILADDEEANAAHPGWRFLRQARDEEGQPMLYLFDRRTDPDEERHLSEHDPRRAEVLARYRAAFLELSAREQALPRSPVSLRRHSGYSEEEQGFLGALGYTDAPAAAEEQSEHRELAPLPVPGEDRTSWRPDAG
jgi:arylsulfatase A-like enzyme